MASLNKKYLSFIEDKNEIKSNKMVRGKFYLIKEYTNIDGIKKKYSDNDAPIIYVLFASERKDIIHAIKISEVAVNKIKKFFSKLVNKKTEQLEMKGNSKTIYESIISKSPNITSEAYRTYNMSGLGKVIELSMDVTELTPKR